MVIKNLNKSELLEVITKALRKKEVSYFEAKKNAHYEWEVKFFRRR